MSGDNYETQNIGRVPGHDHRGDSISPDELRINNPENWRNAYYGGQDTPAVIRTNDVNRTLALQVQSDTKGEQGDLNPGYSATIDWLSKEGERIGRLAGDAEDGHVQLYVKEDEIGSGDTSPRPHTRWNVDKTNGQTFMEVGGVEGTSSAIRLMPGQEGEFAKYAVFDGARNEQAYLGFVPGSPDTLRLWDRRDGRAIGEYRFGEQAWDWNDTAQTGLREVGASPSASDLSSQEWAFSQDYDGAGTPAWLYKDSTGTAHVLETDGTL